MAVDLMNKNSIERRDQHFDRLSADPDVNVIFPHLCR